MTEKKTTYQELEQRIFLLEQELRDKNERLSLLQEEAHGRERDIQDITSNFETFFNTINDFLFVIDEQGNILHCNKTVEKRLGYTADELKGKSILSVHPEDRRSETASVSADVIAGKLASFQIPLVTKHGKQIFVETHANAGSWNGKPAFFGVSKDISKLKLSEEKFSSAFYLNPSACSLSEANTGAYIEVNDAFCKLFGYSREETIGSTAAELQIMSEKTRDEILSKADELGRIFNAETQLKTKSGEIKSVLLSGQNIAIQDVTYRYTVIHDVTEIQKAKEIAEENEKKFSIAFHSSPSVSMITNIDTGEILEANDAVELVAGFSRAETIGNSIFNLNLWMIEGAREKFINLLRRDKRVIDFESTFRKKSGETFIGLISGQSIQIKNQDCLLSIIHDITDRKNTETELLKAKEKVEDSEEKFKNLYDSLSISYLILKDGVCIECNEATMTIYGAGSKDEIIGKSPIDFSPEFQANHLKSSEEAKRHNQIAIEEGLHTFEWLAQRKNKEEFYAEVSLKRYYYKNELYIQCLTTDITERKRIEKELIAAKERSAENESFLRTLINTLPDLVWLKDKNGVYLTCNKRLIDFIGKTEHEIIGKTDYDLVTADIADFFRQSDIEAISAGKPTISEELISIPGKNHSEYLETIKTPFYRNGELVGVLGIGRNISERKNAELELLKAKEKVEESEEKFKNLYESLSIAYLIIKDGVCVECNKAALEIYGIENKDEIIGKPPTEFSPEYQPNNEKSLDEAIRQTEIAFKTGFHTFEWLGMRKNKELFYNEVSLKKFYYKNELYLQCLTTDITERKRIENELIAAKERSAENELFLRTLINTLPDLVWLKDVNGVFLMCNKRLEEFLGTTELEIIGKTDYDFVKADLADLFRQKDIEAIETGNSVTNDELIAFASDNHSEYIETIKTPFYRNGKLVGVLGIGRNITERKNAELELLKAKEKVEESEIKFRQLAENLNDVVWLRKGDQIVHINPAFEEMYGISREAFYKDTRLLYNVMHPEDIQKYQDALNAKEFLETGKFYCEYRIIRPHNDIRWIISKSSPIIDAKGNQTVYRVGIAIDITERKRIENELIAAKEKAEESDRLKTAFLHNMSHEIRTPLNAISGFSSLLNEPDLSEDDINNFVQIIQINTVQLVSIVNDILTISSLETKQVKPNISNVCINNIADELLAIFRLQALKQNISLYAECPLNDQKSEIETDKTKITQILSNLLSNALKFTHEGFVQFGYRLKGNELEFYVKDSGIGIKQEFHGKIFERFRQGDKSINKLYGGTGLGLAISKAFVELLGGKIWVQSEFGKGSTFYFTLPYKPANKKNE